MKISVVILTSLIMLTACVRFPPQITPRIPVVEDSEKTAIPPGFGQFCQAKEGVLVVFVDKNGQASARACPGIRIEQSLPAGVDESVGLPSTLGNSQKWKMKDDPDPCIEWVVSGYPFYYCW